LITLYFNMRKLFLLFFILLTISSCSIKKQDDVSYKAIKNYAEYLNDSIINLNANIIELNQEVEFWKTTFEDAKYSLEESVSYRDSFEYLKEDLFVYKYKLERIKAYNAIVERDATQSVFFRGWVKRVLED